ncbi:MAG: hypothetical protein ACI7YS_14960, partial [Flavobacterium sp.]
MITRFIENLSFESWLVKKTKALKLLFYGFSGLFLFLLVGFYYQLGPFYTTDTVEYLKLAQAVKNGFFPHSAYYSPGFSSLIGIVSRFLGIKVIEAILLLNIVLSVSTFLLLYQLVKKTTYKGKPYNMAILFFSLFLL